MIFVHGSDSLAKYFRFLTQLHQVLAAGARKDGDDLFIREFMKILDDQPLQPVV